MNSIIIEHNGKLYVQEPWEPMFTQPIELRIVWPTGLSSADYPHFVGEECISEPHGSVYRMVKTGLMFNLEHGEKTKAAKELCSERPIKKPKWARKYNNGRWIR